MNILKKSPKKLRRKSPRKSPRRERKMWSRQETELLKNCVNTYGKKWAYIYKNYPIFKNNGRTQIDLKDKYRNLENTGVEYTIYSQDGCPYCLKAKKLLEGKNFKYKEIKVEYENKDKIFEKLEEKTDGYRYFPIIFYKKKFIGGFADLEKYLK
jgi:glutaredoxin